MFLHLDCRHYLGDRPCRFHRLCDGCPHYLPMGPRVLIVKFGALGDVVRTACLLRGFQKWPEPPHVTWLTSPAALPLVRRMEGVHRALAFCEATVTHLRAEYFDYVLSLDKEPTPAAIAMQVQAGSRLGIGLSRYGTPYPLNEHCESYFELGLDNRKKFHENRLSYPELIFGALGFPYAGEDYRLSPTEADFARADAALVTAGLKSAGLGPRELAVGINPGAGRVFAHKAWRVEGYIELIRRLVARDPAIQCIMLGGPDEAGLLDAIAAAAPPGSVVHPGAGLPLEVFAAMIARMAVVVSGDTLAMHLALATGSRSVAIFGPTCPQEIDMFNRGEKLVSPIDCAPCYLRACDKSPHCQDMVSVEAVEAAVLRQLEIVLRNRRVIEEIANP